jgi:hypothetical protein
MGTAVVVCWGGREQRRVKRRSHTRHQPQGTTLTVVGVDRAAATLGAARFAHLFLRDSTTSRHANRTLDDSSGCVASMPKSTMYRSMRFSSSGTCTSVASARAAL